MTPKDSRPHAIIFDMDGVLVNSNPYHLQKWKDLLNERGIRYDEAELPQQVIGLRNDFAFQYFFGPQLGPEEKKRLNEELEAKFRKIFAPHAKPLPGLTELVATCHAAGIPMAVASAAMCKNVEFVVNAVGFRSYFRTMVSGDEVTHSKPDPEIYLTAARKLGADPASCAAFEDSFVGVEAAKRAGMKCVALGTTFPMDELRRGTHADLIVPGFEAVNLQTLRGLWTAGKQ